MNIMTKPAGAICNLDCGYCYYLEKEKLYPGTADFRMNDDVLENYIRQYIDSQLGDFVAFAWQGGEPTLLGVAFFEKAVKLQQKYGKGKIIENSLQTNGVLLNDAWCRFFRENNFLIGLSIDGPEKLHNAYRVNKGGKGTFSEVMAGLNLLQKHRVPFNTLTVVHRDSTSSPLEIYRFLKQTGSRHMQFIPIVERLAALQSPQGQNMVKPDFEGDAQVSPWSVGAEQYGDFLIAIFDEWVRHDVGDYFVQLFDVTLEAWMSMPSSLCVFRPTCGDALALEHNGDLYSCDHYVYPQNRLGNIMEEGLAKLVNSPQQQRFGRDKRDTLPQYCRECDVRFACHGECPKHRFIQTPDGEEGLNYLCAGYKKFFRYIDPYMRFMTSELRQGRSAAGVMAWARSL